MEDHGKKAEALFYEGYNCAQAAFCAFCDETGIPADGAARLASSFGGGMGRMREVCGAVSGALMALGYLRGYAQPNDPEAKKAHYALVREFAERFRAKNGSILCRELLADVQVTPGGEPEARTPEFYRRRPCAGLISSAGRIADALLAEEDGDEPKGETTE